MISERSVKILVWVNVALFVGFLVAGGVAYYKKIKSAALIALVLGLVCLLLSIHVSFSGRNVGMSSKYFVSGDVMGTIVLLVGTIWAYVTIKQ